MDAVRISRMLGLVAMAGGLAGAVNLPVPAGAAGPTAGGRLYREHCASCHGRDLEGQPDWQSPRPDGILPAPPHDDTGHTWHHGDRMLFGYTKLGGAEAMRRMGVTGFRSGMPGFQDILTDDEIRAILDYIRSSWGARERTYQKQITARE